MWFANLEQMSMWISLPPGEKSFFEYLDRKRRSDLEKKACEELIPKEPIKVRTFRKNLASLNSRASLGTGLTIEIAKL